MEYMIFSLEHASLMMNAAEFIEKLLRYDEQYYEDYIERKLPVIVGLLFPQYVSLSFCIRANFIEFVFELVANFLV
jgi:hypothetical protein